MLGEWMKLLIAKPFWPGDTIPFMLFKLLAIPASCHFEG